jgi:ligand-binding sensor domain-containing protein
MIYSLLSDGASLWIATDGGLVKLNRQTEETTVYTKENSGLPGNDVRSFAKDSDGKLWITTYSGGLCVFDGTSWQVYDSINSGLHNRCYAIAIDNNNDKWISSGNCLMKFDITGCQSWTTPRSSLMKDSWVIHDMKFDKNGELWLAGFGTTMINTEGATLIWTFAKFSGDAIQTYTNITGSVSSITIDGENNKWFGDASGGGLYKYTGTGDTFANYSTTFYNGDISSKVQYVTKDIAGNLWLACNGYIVKFDGKKSLVNYGSVPDIDAVRCMEIDAEGVIWIGTSSSGLYRYSSGVFRKMSIGESGSGIASVAAKDDPVVSVQYCDLLGKPVTERQKGSIYVVKELRQSGKITARKIVCKIP